MDQLRFIFIFLISSALFGQKVNNDDAIDKILEEICECIDDVERYDRLRTDILVDIAECIDRQVVSYQLINSLTNIALDDSEEDTDIIIGFEKDSDLYKKAYRDIEDRLSDECDALNDAIISHDKLLDNSVSEDPEARRYYSLGIQESNDGNYERALEYYKEAVRVDDNFAFAWDNIGFCNRKLGNYEEALAAYEKSLSISPKGTMPLQNIAIVYEYMGEYHKAIDAYKRMGEIYPDDPEVNYGIGRIYAEMLEEDEIALDYICKAFLKYIEIKSPYRSDAELLFSIVFKRMKEKGKEDEFIRILNKYDINVK